MEESLDIANVQDHGLPVVEPSDKCEVQPSSPTSKQDKDTGATVADDCNGGRGGEGFSSSLPACGVRLTPEAEAMAQSMRRSVPLRRPECEVSVVCFNMLLKGFDEKWYYPSIGPELRAWSYRKPQLRELLFGMDADIYCMQEVEVASFAEEFAFLAEGGYAAVEPRDDSKGKKRPEMAKSAIFFKSSRFELVWSENRSRAVLAALKHVPTDELIYVVSCHLEGAKPEAAARVSQVKSALERLRLDQLRRNLDPKECPLIFAGDFNCEEDSAVCHLLSSGALSKDFRDPWAPDKELLKADFSHEWALRDLYGEVCGSLLKQRPVTFCSPNDAGGAPLAACVDFVFYSHLSLRPTAVRLPLDEAQEEAARARAIPADWHISDHVPLGGVFAIRKAEEKTDASSIELV
ncbi:CCR4 [Symbiodinium natans]|uniref:CCR4 protein n=1 Tax=Symbiodinium natans TaxID=878477 RepID=A0A812NXF5_9DINO|nr:CCR4 [Symbiodinium natans]